MRDILIVLNIHFLPGKWIFEKAYAAIDERKRFPTVPVTETRTVLNMYLEKGTHETFI